MAFISATSIIRKKSIMVNANIVLNKEAGNLNEFFMNAYDHLKIHYPKFYKMDPLSKAGFLASEVLLLQASLKNYLPQEISLVLANTHASLDTDLRYAEASTVAPSPSLFVYTLANIVAGEICIRNHIQGENAFFISAAFDASLLHDYVTLVLRQDSIHACIAGWIDVMDEHHDVFLYLVEKEKKGLGLDHSIEQLSKLYKFEYGTVDGRS